MPQGRIAGRRVRDPMPLLRDVTAALGIGFERHDNPPQTVMGNTPLLHSTPVNTAVIRATESPAQRLLCHPLRLVETTVVEGMARAHADDRLVYCDVAFARRWSHDLN